MGEEKWKTCMYSTGKSGTIVVDVNPFCPNGHIIKGRLVSSKKTCRYCKDYKEKK